MKIGTFRKPIIGSRIDHNHRLSRGLEYQLLMNEGGGTITRDISGNRRDGIFNATMVPSSSWVKGAHGDALSFDGTNDEVTVSHPPTDTGTVAFWMKATSNAPSTGRIMGSDGDWEIRYLSTASGQLEFDFMNSQAVTISATDWDEWHQITGTWSDANNSAQAYRDGQLIDSASPTGPMTLTGSTGIGQRNGFSSEYYDGLISTFQVYSRILTADEVMELYYEPFSNILPPHRRVKYFIPAVVTVPYTQPMLGVGV